MYLLAQSRFTTMFSTVHYSMTCGSAPVFTGFPSGGHGCNPHKSGSSSFTKVLGYFELFKRLSCLPCLKTALKVVQRTRVCHTPGATTKAQLYNGKNEKPKIDASKIRKHSRNTFQFIEQWELGIQQESSDVPSHVGSKAHYSRLRRQPRFLYSSIYIQTATFRHRGARAPDVM